MEEAWEVLAENCPQIFRHTQSAVEFGALTIG
jgi:hypothetical protein